MKNCQLDTFGKNGTGALGLTWERNMRQALVCGKIIPGLGKCLSRKTMMQVDSTISSLREAVRSDGILSMAGT